MTEKEIAQLLDSREKLRQENKVLKQLLKETNERIEELTTIVEAVNKISTKQKPK
jgi:cell division septum initiation protein DivIVA